MQIRTHVIVKLAALTSGVLLQESCGSESGVVRAGGPRRGETQPRCGVYSSQDSLPDSPYSSQSLDSHASQGGPGSREITLSTLKFVTGSYLKLN